jgi:hypothetical protein
MLGDEFAKPRFEARRRDWHKIEAEASGIPRKRFDTISLTDDCRSPPWPQGPGPLPQI